MKLLLSFIVMVTVSPVAAVATLILWDPQRWGGSVHPVTILAMSFFGLIMPTLWPTYIPALVATPFVMRRLAQSQWFKRWPLAIILVISALFGGIAGIGVISIIV